MPDTRARGSFLTVMSVLLAVLAFSNFSKWLQHWSDPSVLGIVTFGVRFDSTLANLVLGAVMGSFLATYSYGLWILKPWVKAVSVVYAFYVPTNLVLFWYLQTGPPQMPVGGMIGYLAISLPGSIGTALYIAYHREQLWG